MSRKPTGKGQTNLISGKSGKLNPKMPSSLKAGTKPAPKSTQASKTAAPRANKQWGQVQQTSAKMPHPSPGQGRDPNAVPGFPKGAHDSVMGITKPFSPKAKTYGDPRPNSFDTTGVPGFPQSAYALTNKQHGTLDDKPFAAYARGNSKKQGGK